MKTYKNLWKKFISVENFELAARKAIKSKKSKSSVREFLKHKDELLKKLREKLMRGEYKTSEYTVFTIYEPKKREIYKLPLYPDHILHHALINVLGPIWQKMFIRDSYACIPGRGLHAASRRTMDFVRRNNYVLQCDIRKFYPSVNHKKMMQIVARKIRDSRILKILNEVICSVRDETNLPIGNLTSQWLGNVYLNELDYFVKQCLHWRDYIRYCDDFCLYGNNRYELKSVLEKVKIFIEKCLMLRFSRTVLRRTIGGIDFIGYRHFKKFVMLRKNSVWKIKRRVLNIIKHRDYSDHAVGQLAAAHGWVKWACTYNLKQSIIKTVFGMAEPGLIYSL